MSCILAIDYGLKRTGIAITDELQMIASPLETVRTHDLWSYLAEIIERKKIAEVVVGKPMGLSGGMTDSSAAIAKFQVDFQKKWPNVKLASINEMFTSKMASQTLIAGGAKKSQRQKKGELDKISAAIILQDYLANRSI